MNDIVTPSWIIAEAGVNHNGDINLAKKLIDVAAEAYCDSIKFQVFDPKALTTRHAAAADYQRLNSEKITTQQQMLSDLMLDKAAFIELQRYARSKQIEFLATPFDLDNLNFLTQDLDCETIKIGSGDLTDGPLLLAAAQQGCNVILSTGMATLGEIESALMVLAYGYRYAQGTPAKDDLISAYISPEGRALLKQHVTLMHCCSQYPASANQVNLLAISTLHQAFQLPVGYSDHSQGIVIPIAAATLGACVIEKHITLDRTMEGPDHAASLEPEELKAMVGGIREAELALGHGMKMPSPAELTMRQFARKSLVAAETVASGDAFGQSNLTSKRPGTGLSPMNYWQMLEKTAAKDFAGDDLITME